MSLPIKSWVMLSATGKVVSSVVRRTKTKPKNGRWMEIPSSECCELPTDLETPVATAGTITTTGFILDWPDVTDADQYLVQISTSSVFASILQSSVKTTSTATITGLTTATTYYSRVKAIDSTGTLKDSPYSAAVTTTTA